MTEPSAPRASRQPQRFGPDVPAIARLMACTIEPADSLALLVAIDRQWPDLPFRDFMAARVLAAALVMPTEGTA